MDLLRARFDSLRHRGRTALIPFIMGGEPSLSSTGGLLLALEDAGADLIEVGIPFSDPLADGPVIQGASARALARGTTPAKVLAAVAAVRRRLTVPVVALSYWNPIMQFACPPLGMRGRRGGDGDANAMRRFVRAARQAGLSGVIVPDLPVEESQEFRALTHRERFACVSLAAPTSPPERLRLIARASQGFIYYVSVTGTTGAQYRLPPTLVHGVRQLKLLTTKPVCVGFGISTPGQAARVAAVADGVIVGSALVRALEGARGAAVTRCAARFVKRFRAAV